MQWKNIIGHETGSQEKRFVDIAELPEGGNVWEPSI
jgi:hypothetical protein